MKVEIKKINGELIYSGEAGSVKDCVENLVRGGVDLSFADLSHAELNDAKLNRAKLNGAKLNDAELNRAELNRASIISAEIKGVCRMDFGGWSICITTDRTVIGCQSKRNSFWLKATPERVACMDSGAEAFWAKYGTAVKAAINAVMNN